MLVGRSFIIKCTCITIPGLRSIGPLDRSGRLFLMRLLAVDIPELVVEGKRKKSKTWSASVVLMNYMA